MNWLTGKVRGFIAFVAISALLLGGLGWATHAAMRVETDQRLAAANTVAAERLFLQQKEQADKLRLALWRLDSRLSPALAREESRPFPHYVALHTPFPALTSSGIACAPGQVYLPSPLLTAEIPDWMKLHFQLDQTNGWTSPQVIPDDLQKMLRKQPIELALNNVTPERAQLLKSLKEQFPATSIMKTFREMGVTAVESERDAQRWAELQDLLNSARGGRAGNPNVNARLNDPSAKADGAGGQPQAPGPANSALQQQLDFAYRVVFREKARREGQWAYIFDDIRANVAPGSAPDSHSNPA